MTPAQATDLINRIKKLPGILGVWTETGEQWTNNVTIDAGVDQIIHGLQIVDNIGNRALVDGVTFTSHGEGVVTAMPLGHPSMKSLQRAVRRALGHATKTSNGTTLDESRTIGPA